MLLFLDIDGVMVQANSWKRVELLEDGFYRFSEKAVKSLNEILNKTGASILLTSSHKSTYSIEKWKELFNSRGINADISKMEDNINRLSRRDEILNWLDNNDYYGNYVIIDDDKSLHELPSEIKDNVIFTRSFIGLCEDDTSNAISILERKDYA